MAKDYTVISRKIVEQIGGIDNIANVTYCMTRLRFVLKDETLADDEAVKAIDGVMGLVKQGGQYQIIIGNHVGTAYQEVLKLGNFGEQSEIAKGEKKEPLTLKKVGNNILDAIVGTMSPLIPAIIGGSMVKLLVMLLGMAGILSADSETYKLINTIGDGAFYFLPMLVAASAAKKFKTDMFLAISIAGVLIHPDFRSMMEAVTVGDTAAHFMGIPIASVKYTYTVIPSICMTWILSYIERGVDKITPAVTKNFLKPMLILLIAAPIAILIIGPAGIYVGEGISSFVFAVQDKLGFVAVGIMGAIWPLLVITGMHRVFTPTILQTISETGMEGTVMPSEIGANLSLGGVSLAVALKTKNSELRQTALAAASSALIAGTTEPALYGVAVRLKRPLLASLITGFVCGCLAGIGGLASRSMVSPSVLTGVQFIDPANPGRSIAWIAGITILSIVLSFVLTLVIGFEDIPEEEK
jgi:glucose-like phosphotransferase system IIB component